MRILALVPGGISDQILFFPTIEGLKAKFPQSQIDVVVEPRAKEAYGICKSVRDTVIFDFQGRNSLADWGNLLGMIRDREYQVAVSFDDRWSTGLLLWLSGIPTRLGAAAGPSDLYMTSSVVLDSAKQSTAKRYYSVLKSLSITAPCQDPIVNIPAKDLEWADVERRRLGVKAGGYVLICGQGDDTPASYPAEQWRTVIQDFQKKQPDMPIVLADRVSGKWISSLTQSFPSLKVTSPISLGQTVALFAGASLSLCCEGPEMHLAAASKSFTLALLSSTSDSKILLPQTDRVIGIKSPSQQVSDISPSMILEKIWGG
ncbi:MAG: lipopolysaccharide heptosyltransferase family protein [Alkalinema sp. CAN_BIN05]|nr:lipopolysaccharide heptosyltransferase family protein [Alkalinema sp. CAN_BIN05]